MWPFTSPEVDSNTHSERQPLLGTTSPKISATNVFDDLTDVPPPDTTHHKHPDVSRPTPLPHRQLVVLCLMRITEPISQGLIQPFINQMLEDLKVTPDRTQIGYYAGLITSLFAFCQLCTTFWWGRLSDRIGRKPILLTGLTGLSISIISFGLQTSFAGLLVARSLAGIMNGNVAVVRSVLAEITDDTNKARAFALLPLSAAIGTIVGPMMGGYLAQPAQQYPKLFGHIEFLKAYPYFLPCFIAGMTNGLAVLLGFLYLEETLESKQKGKGKRPNTIGQASQEEDGFAASENRADTVDDGPPPIRTLLSPTVLTILCSYFFLALQNSSWGTLVPLYSYTRVEDGGLGLSLNQIGSALSSGAVIAILVQTVIFPNLQLRWGTLPLYQTVLAFVPVSFALLPVIRWAMLYEIEKHGAAEGNRTAYYGLMGVLAIKVVTGMGMVCVTLLLNAAATTKSSFGALNGLGQSCSALARSFGPASAGALFALSINKQYLGGNLIWVVAISVCGCTWASSLLIRLKPEPLRSQPRSGPIEEGPSVKI